MYAPSLTITQIQEKILSRTTVDDNGCWNWTGAKSKSGYGYFTEGLHKPMWRVHRLMWALTHNESMPRVKNPEFVIDHICNNRACFRPSHLQKITQQENLRRYPGKDGSHISYHLSTHKNIQPEEIKYYKKTQKSGFVGYYPHCMPCRKFHDNNVLDWKAQRLIDKTNEERRIVESRHLGWDMI